MALEASFTGSGLLPTLFDRPYSRAFQLRMDPQINPGRLDRPSSARTQSARRPAPPPPNTNRLRNMQQVPDACERERIALGRRLSARRSLEEERRRSSVRAVDEVKKAAGVEMRQYMDKIMFRELRARMLAKHGEDGKASDTEVINLSHKLNVALAHVNPDPKSRTWFSLFRFMDEDDTGLISYYELVRMVRQKLKLDTMELPVSELQRVWLTLDTDGSGQLSSGEFGAFMRAASSLTVDAQGNPVRSLPPTEMMRQRAQARRAQLLAKAEADRTSVQLETVARAKRTMLHTFRSAAKEYDAEADRLQLELDKLTGRARTPRDDDDDDTPTRPSTAAQYRPHSVAGAGAQSAPGAPRGRSSASPRGL